MTTIHRIKYRLTEHGNTKEGVWHSREGICPEYIEKISKAHPDAPSIYLEYLDSYDSGSSTSSDTILIIP